MKVVLPWPVADQAYEPLPESVEVVEWLGGDPPAAAFDAEFVVAPYAARKPGWLAAFPRLAVLQSQTAGVDWLLAQLPEGVVLCDASGVHDRSTAEWVMTAVLAANRQIPRFVRQQDAGVWRPASTTELGGR